VVSEFKKNWKYKKEMFEIENFSVTFCLQLFRTSNQIRETQMFDVKTNKFASVFITDGLS
jgi:hypothetical protein